MHTRVFVRHVKTIVSIVIGTFILGLVPAHAEESPSFPFRVTGNPRIDSVLCPFDRDSALQAAYPELRLPSPSRAALLSTGATLVPVAAAAVIWTLQRDHEVVERLPSGEVSRRYEVGPDRALPAILLLSGVMVGPSVGYFYGDCSRRGLTGAVARLGVGAFAGFFAVQLAKSLDHDGGMGISCDELLVVGAIVGLGSAHAIFSAAKDMTQVRGCVRANNLKRAGVAMSVAPAILPETDTPALALTVRF